MKLLCISLGCDKNLVDAERTIAASSCSSPSSFSSGAISFASLVSLRRMERQRQQTYRQGIHHHTPNDK